MIYLIDKVLPQSYFANNLRALSGKHKDSLKLKTILTKIKEKLLEKTVMTSDQKQIKSSINLYQNITEFFISFQ